MRRKNFVQRKNWYFYWSCRSISLAVVFGITVDLVQAAVLEGWKFDPQNDQLEISLESETTPNYFLLAEPPRIVIDLPNTELGKVETKQNYSGLVRQVRASQFTEEDTRIVLELAPEVILSPQQVKLYKQETVENRNYWVLQPKFEQRSTVFSTLKMPPAGVSTSSTQTTVRVPPLNPTAASTSIEIPIAPSSSD